MEKDDRGISMSDDALLNLILIYKKEWFDMSLTEQMDALEQYIYGDVKKYERQ